MKDEDWLDRWQKNQIGFHDTKVNQYLVQYVADSNLKSGDTVFVPLCGKTPDILWLAQQGFHVVGIELSDIAITSFFSEQDLHFETFESGRLVVRKSDNISLLQGNFFDLSREDIGDCQLVFDRAALIALDKSVRQSYVDHMYSIMGENSDMMLITLDYEQSEMNGPPFAVSQAEVHSHYDRAFQIETVHQTQIVDESPRWRAKGLTSLMESVYYMNRKS